MQPKYNKEIEIEMLEQTVRREGRRLGTWGAKDGKMHVREKQR